MDMARACVVVCAYGSDTMHSSFFPAVVFCVYSWMWRLAYLLSWFPLYFDTGHIACVRRASLFWSGACFLLFLPSFPLVLTGCIAAFTSTCPSGWRWVGVWMFGGMWLLLLPEVFLLSVSVSGVFFRCQFYQYFLFGLLGVWYVLSASRGIYFLRFTGCWWHSYLPFILVVVCRL